jgi:phage terminase small subunit
MPAKKPLPLLESHLTKAEIQERSERESALTPTELLSAEIPAGLRGKRYEYAAKVWRRCISLYMELSATIATPLDENLLEKYCKAEQQFIEMEKMREEKIAECEVARDKASKIKLGSDEKQIKEWRLMWDMVNGMEKIVTVLDARLDAKGKYIHSMQQSLYLTPRSRAGVAPKKKEPKVIEMFAEQFD